MELRVSFPAVSSVCKKSGASIFWITPLLREEEEFFSRILLYLPVATHSRCFGPRGLRSWSYLLTHASAYDSNSVTIKEQHCHMHSCSPALCHQKPFTGCPPYLSPLFRSWGHNSAQRVPSGSWGRKTIISTRHQGVICAVTAQKRGAGVRESFPEEGIFELTFQGCGVNWVQMGQYVPGRGSIREEWNQS